MEEICLEKKVLDMTNYFKPITTIRLALVSYLKVKIHFL